MGSGDYSHMYPDLFSEAAQDEAVSFLLVGGLLESCRNQIFWSKTLDKISIFDDLAISPRIRKIFLLASMEADSRSVPSGQST